MKAFRFVDHSGRGRIEDIPIPEAGPGEVLIRVSAAGLCRTDLTILASTGAEWPDPPFTLGHEISGVISALGSNVSSLAVNDPVLVSAINFCGSCAMCVRGRDHTCRNMTHSGYGVGLDGGLAEYIVTKAIHVVGLGSLDPIRAAPLGDAAATAYHAVGEGADALWPGATAAVIGVGGLGAFAVQYLQQLHGVRVIAVDASEERLEAARIAGAAHTLLPTDSLSEDMHRLAGGDVAAVFDFVGTSKTLADGLDSIGSAGKLVVAGIGGGEILLGWERMPRNSAFVNSRGYTRGDLADVIALAEDGRISVPQTHYRLDEVEQALGDLSSARVHGRAVVLPNGE